MCVIDRCRKWCLGQREEGQHSRGACNKGQLLLEVLGGYVWCGAVGSLD